MIPVILESPFSPASWEPVMDHPNIVYARRAIRHSLSQGEAPIASHLLYTQPGILQDEFEGERKWGIDAGHAWICKAAKMVLYLDRGLSLGMKFGIRAAIREGCGIYARWLDGPVDLTVLGNLEFAMDGCCSYQNQ